uniref:Uncharacterized protein n=1 Tax=Rhizophora mucronata TaxID=61149 RepID=A0A2P2PSV1_RHIMU
MFSNVSFVLPKFFLNTEWLPNSKQFFNPKKLKD